ncbi:MAG: hypothetical protein MZW92_05000 [Comamonadaceae bacterium]|nr:hypothetical protein [Comamonadaceae bacterium]
MIGRGDPFALCCRRGARQRRRADPRLRRRWAVVHADRRAPARAGARPPRDCASAMRRAHRR